MELIGYINEIGVLAVALFLAGVHTLRDEYIPMFGLIRQAELNWTQLGLRVGYYFGISMVLAVSLLVTTLLALPLLWSAAALGLFTICLIGGDTHDRSRFVAQAGWAIFVIITGLSILNFWPW